MRFVSLERPLPPRMRSAIAHVLCATFARTFRVAAPRLYALPPDEALFGFREFSAACMEATLASPALAATRSRELERNAARLGSLARSLARPRAHELPALVSYLYAAIGIDMSASLPEYSPVPKSGQLVFRRCYFSDRYTPTLCAFMSAFDSGFVSGLTGGPALAFEARITQGAPCCRAVMGAEEGCLDVIREGGSHGP